MTTSGTQAAEVTGPRLLLRPREWVAGWRAGWERLENPVLGREFRGRMRGARSHLITGAYALLVIMVVLTAYAQATAGGTDGNQLASKVGRSIWSWGCLVQSILLPLMVPAFTCAAITFERERDMLELLLLTQQSAAKICIGKLASGVGLGLMLLLSSVPVLSLSLLLGGVSPLEIVCCLAVLVSTVLAAGAVGLFASCVAPKTVTASTMTYLLVGTGLFAPPFLSAMVGSINSFGITDWGMFLMLFAVLAATFPIAVALATGALALLRPDWSSLTRASWMGMVGLCWTVILSFLYLPGAGEVFLQSQVLVQLIPPFAIVSIMMDPTAKVGVATGGTFWLLCTLLQLGIAATCFYGAIRRVRRMRAW